jgi:hypothetical protein
MKQSWKQLADEATIKKTVTALADNGVKALVVQNAQEAKAMVLELIPKGSQVMTMSSLTLIKTGLHEELNESGNYQPVRDELSKLDKKTQAQKMNQLGAAPEYAVGSVHAVTQDGHCLIASNTGSQLPAYVYAALNVVWIVGAQKIVKDTQEGISRVYDYCLPLEDKRAREAYGSGSGVNKLLIFNKEISQGRVTMILVKEILGF